MSAMGVRVILLAALGTWVVVAATAPAASGQERRVQAELDRNRIYEGEGVQYEVRLVDFPAEVKPRLEGFTDFAVTYLGPGGQRTFAQFVNGRITRESSYAHVYRLVPRKTGVLTVPPPVAEVEGRKFRGPKLRLEVRGIEKQDIVILDLEASRTRVYRLEPFTLTLNVHVRALPAPHDRQDPLSVQSGGREPRLTLPFLDIPRGLETENTPTWLRHYLNRTGNGVAIPGAQRFLGMLLPFSTPTFRPQSRRVKHKGLDNKARDYVLYTFERTFTPGKAGTYAFGAATLKGVFGTGVEKRQDRFGRERENLTGKDVYAVSHGLTVEVLEPPETGRPPHYTGGIGTFRIWATAAPKKLRVGDPLTITVYVEGKAGLEDVGPLKLSDQEAITKHFKVYEDAPTGEIKAGRKIFVHSIRPLTASATEVPPIEFSYFDVDRDRYLTLRTDAIPLEVAEAERLNPNEVVMGKTSVGDTDLTEIQEGLYANLTGVDRLGNQHLRPGFWFGLVGGLLALYGALALGVGLYRLRNADPAVVRRRGAFSRGLAALREARSAGGPAPVLMGIHGAFLSVVADVRNVPVEGLTARDVGRFCRDLGDADLALEVESLVDRCEAARFGAVANTAEEVDDLVDRAGAHMRALAGLHRRKSGRIPAGPAVLLGVALLALGAEARAGDRARLFIKAQEHFDQARTPEDFLRAAALFRKVLEGEGYRNGTVLYNLGNAYFRAGHIGRAIAAYREAERYLPGEDRLAANLNQALNRRADQFPEAGRPLIDHIFFWTRAVAYPTQFRLTLGASALAFLLACLRLFWPRLKGVKPALLGVTIAALLLCAGSGLTAYRYEWITRGVLTASKTQALKAPHGDRAFDRPLHEGTEFVLLEKRGGKDRDGWYRIRFAGDREAWIPAEASVTY